MLNEEEKSKPKNQQASTSARGKVEGEDVYQEGGISKRLTNCVAATPKEGDLKKLEGGSEESQEGGKSSASSKRPALAKTTL